jgi:hypothetical protein
MTEAAVVRPRALTRIASHGFSIFAVCLLMALPASGRAFALSEIKQAAPSPDSAAGDEPVTSPDRPRALPPLEGPEIGPDGGLPDPAPAIRRSGQPDGVVLSAPADTPPTEILRDLSALPAPAARMRELIMEAARTGDPEKLRALLGAGPTATQLSLSGIEEDPIEYLRSISGDGKGIELLAIMLDLLDAGFVHVDQGGANDLYVWPYFAATDLDALTPEQTVELLRIVTAGDLDDMRTFGNYNFFRLGISPEGEWRFFISGD